MIGDLSLGQTKQSRLHEVQVGQGSSNFFGFAFFQVLAELKF